MQEHISSFIQEFKEMLGYFWLTILAIWGGTANYMTRLKENKTAFSFAELVGEWAISGFAGLITAFMCVEAGLTWQMTAVFTGVAGHLGGRTIAMLEDAFREKFNLKEREE